MRVKINIGDIINNSLEIINKSKSQKAKDYGFSIGIGFEIFVEYLKEIVNRAIELDDAIILEDLINIGVIKCTKEEAEKISKEAKKIKESKTKSKN